MHFCADFGVQPGHRPRRPRGVQTRSSQDNGRFATRSVKVSGSRLEFVVEASRRQQGEDAPPETWGVRFAVTGEGEQKLPPLQKAQLSVGTSSNPRNFFRSRPALC